MEYDDDGSLALSFMVIWIHLLVSFSPLNEDREEGGVHIRICSTGLGYDAAHI